MRRLGELYRAMSDGELLRLAERPSDLTDAAQGALHVEMASRGLNAKVEPVAAGFTVESDRFAADGAFARDENSVFTQQAPNLKPEPLAKGLAKGTTSLMVFHDAFAAGEACDLLEAEGFEIQVRDVAARGDGSVYGGPPVALQVIVRQDDLERAIGLLRAKMGLFPQQEVEVADEVVDDGSTVVLGNFGHREDANEVAHVLEETGVWHRIVANADGSVQDDDCFTLEVKEIDLARAGEIIERAMNLPKE